MNNAMLARKQACTILEHAIGHIARYDSGGWLTNDCDGDAVYALRHALWGLEAMDSPATNRFWDEQRREYGLMLARIEYQSESTSLPAC